MWLVCEYLQIAIIYWESERTARTSSVFHFLYGKTKLNAIALGIYELVFVVLIRKHHHATETICTWECLHLYAWAYVCINLASIACWLANVLKCMKEKFQNTAWQTLKNARRRLRRQMSDVEWPKTKYALFTICDGRHKGIHITGGKNKRWNYVKNKKFTR